MKVVKQTPTKLILREVPFSVWFLGSVSALIGLWVIGVFGKVTTLTCNRMPTGQGNCQLVTSSILKSQVMKMPVKALQGAKVVTISDDNGITYQVVIVINNTQVPFGLYSSSGVADKQAIVSDINNFVGTPSKRSLIVKQDDQGFLIIFGGIFVLGGSLLIGFSNVVNVVIDKNLNNFTLKRQGLFVHKVVRHQIREIVAVEVEESTSSDGNTYRVYIYFVSGEYLLLMLYGESEQFKKQKTVDSLRKFLNLAN